MDNEPIAVALLVIEALDSLSIKHLIVGSLASAVYGEPRSTRDVDILADVTVDHAVPLCRMLEADFNIDSQSILNAVNHRSSFNAIHYDTVFKIDVFVPRLRAFESSEFERRSLRVVAEEPRRLAYVASAEDVILAKLEWYRMGDCVSDQQWRDIVGIFKARADELDIEYLFEMGGGLGVHDLLRKLV